MESYLNDMEAMGYRLDHMSFRYIFTFVNTAARKVNYVFIYTFVKEYDILERAYRLRKEYSASIIPSYHSCSASIYRITDSQVNLLNFMEFRRKYLQRILLHRIIFWLFIGICFLIAALYKSGSFFLILLIICSMMIVLNGSGLLFLLLIAGKQGHTGDG